MQMSVLFWMIYVLSLAIGLWLNYDPAPNSGWHRRSGAYVVLWLLVGILGYAVFGPVVK